MTFVVDIVTGASQGIGRAIAEYIALQRNIQLQSWRARQIPSDATTMTSSSSSSSPVPPYSLIMVGRNVQRGTTAVQDIRRTVGAVYDKGNNCNNNNDFPVFFESCDLSNYNDVIQLKDRIAQRVKDQKAINRGKQGISSSDDEEEDDYKVGILVNDAAECPRRQEFVWRKQTKKGFSEKKETKKRNDGNSMGHEDDDDDDDVYQLVELDKQFATNVLGYHFMIKVFQDHFGPVLSPQDESLLLSSSSLTTRTRDDDDTSDEDELTRSAKRKTHVVNVASSWAGNLDLDDLQFKRRGYDNDTAYRQSKQCNRMLSKVWSAKLGKDVAVVNSCHPGDPRTTLSVALGYNLFSSSPTWDMIENETPIPYLCGFKGGMEMTGGWYQGRSGKPMRCQFERMTKEEQKLFEVCESFCC